jgi:serine/threonine-protein kinase
MSNTHLAQARLAHGTIVGGKYVIESDLGEGGFATVYGARHATVSSLRAAIKVLHAEHMDSDTNRRRFRREAELAAALQSRFIVRVLDAGELQDGRPFIAMEFVDGTPLDALLKKCGRLAPADAARFTEGILRGLEVAHAAGVVHRDLKPANVFAVEEDGESPYSRVLDFGIAKAVDGSSVPVAGTHTIAGQVVCTPEYASPELLSGTVSPAADIYALGHMLAELLDGRAPYDLGTHSLLIAGEHLKPEPVPLGEFSRASGLEHIICRACAKPVEERYPSARAMLDDLRAVMPTLASGPTALTLAAPYRLGEPIARGSGTSRAGASGPVHTTGMDATPTGQFHRHRSHDSTAAIVGPSRFTGRNAIIVLTGLFVVLCGAFAIVALLQPPATATDLVSEGTDQVIEQQQPVSEVPIQAPASDQPAAAPTIVNEQPDEPSRAEVPIPAIAAPAVAEAPAAIMPDEPEPLPETEPAAAEEDQPAREQVRAPVRRTTTATATATERPPSPRPSTTQAPAAFPTRARTAAPEPEPEPEPDDAPDTSANPFGRARALGN